MATDDGSVPTVDKVVAYVVRDGQLAVFVHDAELDPRVDSGLQVPAGTCEAGEPPAVAVLREAREETGLTALRVVAHLGEADYDMRPYAKAYHHRHFFHLAVDGPVPETWTHIEAHAGVDPPLLFRFFWLSLRQAHALAGGQGALLGVLATQVAGTGADRPA